MPCMVSPEKTIIRMFYTILSTIIYKMPLKKERCKARKLWRKYTYIKYNVAEEIERAGILVWWWKCSERLQKYKGTKMLKDINFLLKCIFFLLHHINFCAHQGNIISEYRQKNVFLQHIVFFVCWSSTFYCFGPDTL